MKKIECILCKSFDTHIKQTIFIEEIKILYKKDLSIDLEENFKGLSTLDYVECEKCNLNFFFPVIPGSPIFYEKLQNSMGKYYKNDRYEFFQAKKFIKKTDKVLEIGAGSGYFSELIEVESYFGLEYNDQAIKEAKEKNIKLKNESIEKHSQEVTSFYDVVCNFQVLEHVENPYSFIKSSLNTLVKGGKLIIGVPAIESILTNNLNHTLNFPPHHLSRWSKKTFENFEKIFNVELISVEYEPVSKRLAKNYTRNKIFNIFYLNNGKIINTKPYVFILNKIINKFVSKLNIVLNIDNAIGESVIVVFRKK